MVYEEKGWHQNKTLLKPQADDELISYYLSLKDIALLYVIRYLPDFSHSGLSSSGPSVLVPKRQLWS